MKSLIAWFASNRIVANLLMVLIVGTGILSLFGVKREVMPEFSLDAITVTVLYPGATPAEVEESICVRVEEAVQGLDGVKRIRSLANEGSGTVTIEVQRGFDTRSLLDDIKNRVDGIATFPDKAERPVIQEIVSRLQVINVSVSGDTDERTLKRLGEQVRDELIAIEGISQVELKGSPPYEVSIEVSEEAMRRYGLTFDDVARAVRSSSLDLPGGSVKTETGEILLRTQGQAYYGPDFENIALRAAPDGTRIRLGDVARVVDGFEETEQFSRLDGRPAVLIQVFRSGREGAPEVAALVRDYVQTAQTQMPPGIALSTWQDNSEFLESRQELLLRNAFQGLLLVFGILALFLRMRLAFWVAAGIPITFLGVIALMPLLDVSVNLMSLFAFILVLGLVVDDAIVVGENAFARQRELGDGLGGAIRGAQEVTVPMIFGVLTTVAAFTPFLFVPGRMGNFARVIPLIVIPVLLLSLVESQLIFPAHVSHWKPPRPGQRKSLASRLWDNSFGLFSRGLDWFAARVYGPGLETALHWRYLTLSVGIVMLMLGVGMVGGQIVPTLFFPDIEADNVVLTLTLPQGTPAHVTSEAVRGIESAVLDFGARVEQEEGRPLYRHVMASVGEQPSTGGVLFERTAASSNIGEVNMELVPAAERPLSAAEVASGLRAAIPPIPGATEFSILSTLTLAGSPIDIMVTGPDIEVLSSVAARIREKLADYPGVVDITDSFRGGKPEVKLAIRSEAEGLGLSLQDLARQVRQAFFGEETQRIQRGRDDVRVMVRYPEDERRSLGSLEQMRIRTAEGIEVPFGTVAQIETGVGFAEVRRADRRRAINVTAGVDQTVANPAFVLRDLDAGFLPELIAQYPGVAYSLEGQHAEQTEFIEGLSGGFAVALLAIFILMAIPLNSYMQPLLVMLAIPFGLVGAIFGHYVADRPLSFLSILGMVAVTGVVVNDSLVLIHYINRRRRESDSFLAVVRDAGVARLRPILLTSLTTAAGVTPLILETSLQAQFLIPMAISLASGVLVATVATLVFLPAGFVVFNDIAGLFRRDRPDRSETPAPRPPRDPDVLPPHGSAPRGALVESGHLDPETRERIRRRARDFTSASRLQSQVLAVLQMWGVDVTPAGDPLVAPSFVRLLLKPARSAARKRLLHRAIDLGREIGRMPVLIQSEGDAVAVDIPRNECREVVLFSRVSACLPVVPCRDGSSVVPLGLDAQGQARFMDLAADGPHLLVAGAERSGKTETCAAPSRR